MIRTYKYVSTVHALLNEYVLAFFQKIEVDSNGFRDELFVPGFLPIVNRHRKILKNRFREIYFHVITLSQSDRHLFCQRVIQSNQIREICRGEYRPEAFSDHPVGIEATLKQLFLDLYNQVLDGAPFCETKHTTLRDHFNQFCDTNNEITLCPICGYGELKKSADKTRDQYDHYLPKALYPYTAINFSNLVPCCMECNSLGVKGDKDTIAVSTGKLFFPYDENHKGIHLSVCVRKDALTVEDIEWDLVFTNPDGCNDEIESWKILYSIEARYQGYIQARIKKWYGCYFECMKTARKENRDASEMRANYISFLDKDESFGLNFIRKPSLIGLLSGSNMIQAELEALEYA